MEPTRVTLNPLAGAGKSSNPALVSLETSTHSAQNSSLFQKFLDAAKSARRRTFPYSREDGSMPLSTKLVYALPQFSLTSLTLLIGIHGTLFFNKIGADVAFIAFFTAFARSFDVMTDPIMGWFSDKTRHKWGRRRPYMFWGMFGYGITFILLFSPPAALSGVGTAMWFGVLYVAFYSQDTIANVPYSALGPELSDDSKQRDSLFFWAKLVNGIGILVAAVGPVMLTVGFRDCTCDTVCPLGPNTAASLNLTWNPVWGNLSDANYTITTCPSSGDYTALCCGLNEWCTCREDCDSSCDVDASRTAMTTIAVLFGGLYILFMGVCVWALRERKQSSSPKTPPLVPSLIGTLRNRPFLGLLPAWVMDMAAYTMLGTMLPFFVEYVIRPGTVPECSDGTRAAFGLDRDGQDPADESEEWCKSDVWLGFGLVALIGAQLLAMPLWLCLTKSFGKFRTWLAFNLTNSVTNALFVFAGSGDPKLCTLFAIINGIPAGAQFLTDSIVADVIDYDEFLTGQRSEGRFTIFATFIPKIVSIPAQAIPLAMLAFVGFRPPENGVVQPQPERVKTFIKIVFFVVPSILAIGSFFIKRRFPINSTEITNKITEGVSLHMQGMPAVDPLTKKTVSLFKVTPEELPVTWDLDCFFPAQLREMQRPGGLMNVAARIHRTMRRFQYAAAFSFVVTAATIAAGGLTNDKISFIPAFSIIATGMFIAGALFNSVRVKTAQKLVKCPPDPELLDRWLKHVAGVSDGFAGNERMASKKMVLHEVEHVRKGRRYSTIELVRFRSNAGMGLQEAGDATAGLGGVSESKSSVDDDSPAQ